MTIDELLELINTGKKKISKEDIISDEIEIKYLKRIDKIFKKGLNYYLDPKNLEKKKEASIFFRKNNFNTKLNLGSKKVVNHFEDFKISLSAISKLAEINYDRILPIYDEKSNPKQVANFIREKLYPNFEKEQRDFLKALINKFAEFNILVLEFVETHNKKEKVNIDGFFLNPNVIVLKRHQTAFRREIFTLIHELGHYLLNKEEIEQLDISNLSNHNLSKIEKWCNDFAFYFLAGQYSQEISQLKLANIDNDYFISNIEYISNQTHLSKIAIYTRMLYNNQISKYNYQIIKTSFDEEFRLKQEEKEKQKEFDKLNGIKKEGRAPKPINSPLLISTIQTAYYEGLINEYDVCKSLNISPDFLEKYIL